MLYFSCCYCSGLRIKQLQLLARHHPLAAGPSMSPSPLPPLLLLSTTNLPPWLRLPCRACGALGGSALESTTTWTPWRCGAQLFSRQCSCAAAPLCTAALAGLTMRQLLHLVSCPSSFLIGRRIARTWSPAVARRRARRRRRGRMGPAAPPGAPPRQAEQGSGAALGGRVGNADC